MLPSSYYQAEIEYAMEIIQDFRRGNLPDCPNGATLRQYLAKKLHCNPMRLSKKLSKAMGNTPDSSLGGGNAGSNGPGYAHRAATSAAPNQRRVALERAFHEATLDRKAVLASSAANSVCSSKAPTPPPASVAAATVAKDKNKPVNVPPLGVLPVGGQPQVLQGLATVPVFNPVSASAIWMNFLVLLRHFCSCTVLTLSFAVFIHYLPRSSRCRCTSLVSSSNLNR